MEINKYHECKVKVFKILADGTEKNETETYLVLAINYTDAESMIAEEMAKMYNVFEVTNIIKRNYAEVFTSEDANNDKYYSVKIEYIVEDEKTGKDKVKTENVLVQADDVQSAIDQTNKGMKGSMLDWNIRGVMRTKVIDIFTSNKD